MLSVDVFLSKGCNSLLMLVNDRNDIYSGVIEVGVGDQVVGRQFMCSSASEIKFSCLQIYTCD